MIHLRITLVTLAALLLPGMTAGCDAGADFNARVDSIVEPYTFSVAGWQYRTLKQQVSHTLEEQEEPEYVADSDDVRAYFSIVRGLRDAAAKFRASVKGTEEAAMYFTETGRLQDTKEALAGNAEAAIKRQIQQALAEQGIYHPFWKYLGFHFQFPPPNFKLAALPHLLVVSPRDRIDTIRTSLLQPDMTVPEMEQVEAEVDNLEVSSLVAELGGLGSTYPTLVTDDADIRFVLDTAVHEWTHQYLVFRPLGFLYALHLKSIVPSREIATMNETVADIVGRELSAYLIDKYYADFIEEPRRDTAENGFDFDREMREIRKAVDIYLARGEVETAESYMAERRQYLEDNGYYIRKLNQAYFAFHGRYADRPAFRSPIGDELRELRARSASLMDFLDTAASLSSRQDLKLALEKTSRR